MSNEPINNQPSVQSPTAAQIWQANADQEARRNRLPRFRKNLARLVAVGLIGFLIYYHQAELSERVPVVLGYLNAEYVAHTGGKPEDPRQGAALQKALATNKERDNDLENIMNIGADKSHASTSTVTAAPAPGPGGLHTAMENAKNHAALVDDAMGGAPAANASNLTSSAVAQR